MTSPAPEASRPQVRRAVRDLPAYVPGRPPAPRAGVTTYKLSSNENPNDPLPGVLEAAVEAAGRMNRYPDMGCTALYAALADRLGVPTTHLAAGTGSVAVLYHLLQAFCEPGDEVVYAWRSFEAYPIAVAVPGAVAVPVPLTPDARHDLDAMAAAITDRTRVVIVCSPNNPTGPAVRRAELEAFLDRVPAHVVVVLDEAYREFVRDEDPFDGVEVYASRSNVVAMRTFAKAYGLAGFRVGYAVARSPSRRRSVRARSRSVSRRSPRPPPSPPWSARTSCSPASRGSSPSAPGWPRRCGGRAGRCRMPRATSCGCRWGTARWTSPPPRRRPGSWSGRSPVTGCGSASASRPATTCWSTSLRVLPVKSRWASRLPALA